MSAQTDAGNIDAALLPVLKEVLSWRAAVRQKCKKKKKALTDAELSTSLALVREILSANEAGEPAVLRSLTEDEVWELSGVLILAALSCTRVVDCYTDGKHDDALVLDATHLCPLQKIQ